MSYIKNKANDTELQSWLNFNRNQLLQLGFPIDVLNRNRWNYLLDHGYDVDSGWDLEQLSVVETRSLLDLLDDQFSPDRWPCLDDLRKVVEKA